VFKPSKELRALVANETEPQGATSSATRSAAQDGGDEFDAA
jgi:hypothetical protein